MMTVGILIGATLGFLLGLGAGHWLCCEGSKKGIREGKLVLLKGEL